MAFLPFHSFPISLPSSSPKHVCSVVLLHTILYTFSASDIHPFVLPRAMERSFEELCTYLLLDGPPAESSDLTSLMTNGKLVQL